MRKTPDAEEIYADICRLRAKRMNMIQIANELGLDYTFTKNLFYTRSPKIERLNLTIPQIKSIYETLRSGGTLTDWHKENDYPCTEGHLRKIIRKKGLKLKNWHLYQDDWERESTDPVEEPTW